jgi:serpin B
MFGIGCLHLFSSPAPAAEAEAATDAERSALVESHNAFAFDLYRNLAADKSGDLFFSPVSIATALTMLRGGARGQTAIEMDQAMHITLPPDRLHPALYAVESARKDHDASWELSSASRLWGQSGLEIEPAYQALTRTWYGAELTTVDFGDSSAAVETINTWVSDNTNARITEILSPSSVNASTALVLTNAIWFQGDWGQAFDPEMTTQRPFTRADGSTVGVSMMAQRATVKWAELSQGSALALPYEGGELEMLIVLPDEPDGLPALEATLGAAEMMRWQQSLRSQKVNIRLPSFEMADDMSLSGALTALGMPSVFSGSADLSGIAPGIVPSEVLHKAWVSVDERGTEAAAATAVITSRSAPPKIPVFNADHPFIFFIRDARSGSILFAGRMTGEQSAAGGG